MADHSKIEWTDATWPIVQGCDPVSQGCVGCYAVPLLWRMMHHPDPKISGPLQGVTEKHTNAAGETTLRFTGKLALREDRLDWPLKWRQPKMIFVPSHGDIFHKDVPDSFLDKIFAVMALCPQHTFQVLTKRAERMRAYLSEPTRHNSIELAAETIQRGPEWAGGKHVFRSLPFHNVWLGVSAEDQANADERIPLLLQTPAAVRFVSLEPLLGAIDLTHIKTDEECLDVVAGLGRHFTWGTHVASIRKLDWAIVGGESGPKARPMHPDWAKSLRDQCAAAGVAFFFKQWGEYHPSADHDPATCPVGNRTPDATHLSGKREFMPSEQFRLIGGRIPGWAGMCRVGKKAAGRLLDGVEHNGFPSRTN